MRITRRRQPGNPGTGIGPVSTLALVAVLATSCTTNRLTGVSAVTGSTSSNPLSGVVVTMNEGVMKLNQVIKNTSAPTSTFDLVGDGSGAIGANCTSTDTGNPSGNMGASSCACSYTYTMPDGSTQNYEAPTTYHEADLLRCLYVNIPSAVTSVQVRIHVTTTDSYSNAYTFKFAGTGVTLDPASAATFVQVQRYQCRDSIWIPNAYSSNIYDPFQSEDYHNSYPLNFYTTNMGATIAIYGGGMSGITPASNWNCPSIPNDPNAMLDPTIYSIAADSTGSKYIFKPDGGRYDRSNFHLARQATSVFNIPVDAYIAPGINTLPPDSKGNQTGVPPVGYGAAPIPTGIQGQERCPDSSVSIPAGYKWVKVWLFRMALPQRKALVPTNMAALGNVTCSYKEWNDLGKQKDAGGLVIQSPLNHPFWDCYNGDPTRGAGFSRLSESISIYDLVQDPDVVAAGGRLASRVIDNVGACFNIDPNFHPSSTSYNGKAALGPAGGSSSTVAMGGTGYGVNGSGLYNGPGYAKSNDASLFPLASRPVDFFSDLNFGSGTDLWNRNTRLPSKAAMYADLACGSASAPHPDPAHLCSGISRVLNYPNTGNPAAPAPAPQAIYLVPYDSSPTSIDIDSASSPRYDFLFVVSPTSVMSGDMSNPSSSVHNQYTPLRFMSKGDCNSPDPDAPLTPGDCNPARALRNYGIKFHDVSGAGDPPGSDPSRPGVFPVCALQPI